MNVKPNNVKSNLWLNNEINIECYQSITFLIINQLQGCQFASIIFQITNYPIFN